MQAYSDPKREDDPHALPDLEVSYHECKCPKEWVNEGEGNGYFACDHERRDCDGPSGFYWQSCSPGCLPDSDPCGPFGTEAEALADARGDDA